MTTDSHDFEKAEAVWESRQWKSATWSEDLILGLCVIPPEQLLLLLHPFFSRHNCGDQAFRKRESKRKYLDCDKVRFPVSSVHIDFMILFIICQNLNLSISKFSRTGRGEKGEGKSGLCFTFLVNSCLGMVTSSSLFFSSSSFFLQIVIIVFIGNKIYGNACIYKWDFFVFDHFFHSMISEWDSSVYLNAHPSQQKYQCLESLSLSLPISFLLETFCLILVQNQMLLCENRLNPVWMLRFDDRAGSEVFWLLSCAKILTCKCETAPWFVCKISAIFGPPWSVFGFCNFLRSEMIELFHPRSLWKSELWCVSFSSLSISPFLPWNWNKLISSPLLFFLVNRKEEIQEWILCLLSPIKS